MEGPPMPDAVVRVDNGLVVDVVPRSEFFGDLEDLGEGVLLPGLINAHCHLDYTILRGAILSNRSFTLWVKRINALRQTLTDADFLTSIAAGFKELRLSGVTSVLNIESYPELMIKMAPPPLRTWWFFEMIDIRNRLAGEEAIAGALSFFGKRSDWPGGFGLSPHAPYTASLELYRAAKLCAEQTGLLFTTHLAESDEEDAMFHKGTGALYEFLREIGRNMDDVGKGSSIKMLLENDAVPDGTIVAHMNHVTQADYELLREGGWNRRLHVVHCPRTHEYFGRPPFPLERLRDEGFPISIGTDSLASNASLNLFEELRTLRRAHPSVSPREAWEMVTLAPARALGMEGSLGCLHPGAIADLIFVPVAKNAPDPYAALLENRDPVGWMRLGGVPV